MTQQKKPQLHVSHLNMYLRCGAAYEFRYVKRMIRPPGFALHIGTGTHAGIEVNQKNRLANNEPAPLEQCEQAARDTVMAKIDTEGVALDAEERENPAQARADAIDSAVALTRLHYQAVSPKIKPAFVERPWVLNLPDSPFDLAGTIDLQEGEAQRWRIRDTKTAKRSPAPDAAAKSDQGSVYALAGYALHGILPPFSLDFLVKTKEPKAVTLDSERDMQDVEILLRRFAIVMKSIQAGVFLPASPDSFLCTPRFCGFYEDCPFARKKVAVPAPKQASEADLF